MFWHVVFLFSFITKYFLISLVIWSLTRWLFTSLVFNFHVFVNFPKKFPFVIDFYFIFFCIFLKMYLFLFIFWLHWVFIAACGLSVVAASGGFSSLRCAGFLLWWLLLLRSMGSRCVSSVVVARGLSSCGTRAQ